MKPIRLPSRFGGASARNVLFVLVLLCLHDIGTAEETAPTFTGILVKTDGIQLNFAGSPQATYWLEHSSDLSAWSVTLGATTGTDGQGLLLDSDCEGPVRFYRLTTAEHGGIHSVNTMGYVRREIAAGTNWLSHPFIAGNNRIPDLLPDCPEGTMIGISSAAGFHADLYMFGEWFSSLSLNIGDGASLINPGAPFVIIFVGELWDGAEGVKLSAGERLVGSVHLDLELQRFPAADGDEIEIWDPIAQAASRHHYIAATATWDPAFPFPALGEAFWFRTGESKVWYPVPWPPRITRQPSSRVVVDGETVSFGVEASGSGPLTYAWYRNQEPLSDDDRTSGSTTASLTIVECQTEDAGSYHVTVSNPHGETPSETVTLVIEHMAPTITRQPNSWSVIPVFGTASVGFSVLAEGSRPLSYQWFKDAEPLTDGEQAYGGYIRGATTADLWLDWVPVDYEGLYTVEVSNAYGTTVSDPARLTISDVPPEVRVQPIDSRAGEGDPVIFEVQAAGSQPLEYRWFKDGEALVDGGRIGGVTTPLLSLAECQVEDEGIYHVQVSNGYGTVESDPVRLWVGTLAVNHPPSFVKGPDVSVLEDAGAQTFAGWATAISAGPPDEAGQSLTFELTAEEPSVFAAGPALSADGTLTFTTAPDWNGTAEVTVALRDDGGTENGGQDTSATQTFLITVRAAPRPPLLNIEVSDDAQLTITWSSSPGMSYQVLSTTDLSCDWTPHTTHPAVLVASGDWLAVSVPPIEDAQFFQVRALVISDGVVLNAEGGTYHMAHGITLDVPPGAVFDDIPITIVPLAEEEIQPVLDSHGVTEKHFLAGFQAEPYGLELAQPIRVTLPALPLPGMYSVPLHFAFNWERGVYSYAYTDLIYDPEHQLVTLTLASFSEHLVVAVELPPAPDRSRSGLRPSDLRPQSGDDDEDPEKELFKGYDCQTPETRCRCMRIHVQESSLDVAIEGECYMVVVKGHIDFLDCVGAPRESWGFGEYDVGWIELRDYPYNNPPPLKVGDTIELAALVKNSKGEEATTAVLTYTSLTPELVEVLNPNAGQVTARKCGKGQIKIEAGCDNQIVITLDIYSPIARIRIDPDELLLDFDESATLTAILLDENDQAIDGEIVQWTIDPIDWISLEADDSPVATVHAQRTPGTLQVLAHAGCEFIDPGVARIEVIAPTLQITPASVTIDVNDTVALQVQILDKNGDSLPLDDYRDRLMWTIPVGGIIAFDPSTFTVRGVGQGTAVLGLEYGDATAECVVRVRRAHQLNLNPPQATLFVGELLPLHVQILDASGESLNVHDFEISWTIPGGGVIAFAPGELMVRAVDEGQVLLIAECEGLTASCEITVIRELRVTLMWTYTGSKDLYHDYPVPGSGGAIIYDYSKGEMSFSLNAVLVQRYNKTHVDVVNSNASYTSSSAGGRDCIAGSIPFIIADAWHATSNASLGSDGQEDIAVALSGLRVTPTAGGVALMWAQQKTSFRVNVHTVYRRFDGFTWDTSEEDWVGDGLLHPEVLPSELPGGQASGVRLDLGDTQIDWTIAVAVNAAQ
jgi:hypothetical protein